MHPLPPLARWVQKIYLQQSELKLFFILLADTHKESNEEQEWQGEQPYSSEGHAQSHSQIHYTQVHSKVHSKVPQDHPQECRQFHSGESYC